jgi:hypothetical protein
MAKSYSELLKDPRWQKRRLEAMERDGWACTQCGATDRNLHVHHLRYRYVTMPWDYEDELLTTLCDEHHSAATESMNLLKDSLGRMDPCDLDRVRGYADAMKAAHDGERLKVDNRGEYFIGVAHFVGLHHDELLDAIDRSDGSVDVAALELEGEERRDAGRRKHGV